MQHLTLPASSASQLMGPAIESLCRRQALIRGVARRSTTVLLILLLLAVGLSVGFVEQAFAVGSTFYVSTAGSDTNAGSQAAPWKTIQKAANTAKAGDTVYIGPGTYGERVTISGSGTSGAPIVFTAQSTRPKISRGILISGSYIEFSNFTPWPMSSGDAASVSAVDISGGHNYVHDFDVPTGSLGGSGMGFESSASYNTIANFAITDIPYCGAGYAPGSSQNIIRDGYVHGFGDNVCIGNLDGSYNTLQNVDITGWGEAHKAAGWQNPANNDGDGIHPGPGSSNCVIRGVKIHDIFPAAGGDPHTDAIQWWYPVTNLLVENCVLGSFDTAPSGIGSTAGLADCFNSLFMVSGADG